MEIDKLRNLITKMINVIKPKGVSDIHFKLEPVYKDDSSFFMSITYVVPDDSQHLRMSNMRNSDNSRIEWNQQIKNTIENYFNTHIILNSSSIKSQSYNNKLKEY